MRLQALKRDPAAAPADIKAAEAESKLADKKVRRQLRRTREKHFIRLANRIQTAHDALNYKMYYKFPPGEERNLPWSPDPRRKPSS